MVAVGVPEAVLPENEVVVQVEAAVLNLDCCDRVAQSGTQADFGFRPRFGVQQGEGMITQARLVVFPHSSETFIEASERMTRFGCDQLLKPLKGSAEIAGEENCVRLVAWRSSAQIPVEESFQRGPTVQLDTERRR